jgi:hypothetical protein
MFEFSVHQSLSPSCQEKIHSSLSPSPSSQTALGSLLLTATVIAGAATDTPTWIGNLPFWSLRGQIFEVP